MTTSSTQGVPQASLIPRHIAVIMDGNGRWAKKRFMPRIAGHKRGVDTVREIVRACSDRGVEFLTLFAFSSENWRRPPDEVKFLMQLFMFVLEHEITQMHRNNVRLRVIGDIQSFDKRLVELVRKGEETTRGNTGLGLTIAANYGGRWDILQAVNRLCTEHPDRAGQYCEADLAPYLSLSVAPEPDLFVRTGGEKRVSNFLLWQLAYTEFYFTDTLWPDFNTAALDAAIASYQQRERRFGRTSEQVQADGPQAGVAGG